jgi:uncharacterized membrane protein
MIPFFLYCWPVSLLFPNLFLGHAAIYPVSGLAWFVLILFYLIFALVSSSLHQSVRKEQPKGEQGNASY